MVHGVAKISLSLSSRWHTIYFPSASLESQGREKRYLGALRSSAGFLGLLGVIELFMMVGDPQT